MQILRRIIFVFFVSQVFSFCSSKDSTDSVIICISRTSYKYHARKCQGVRSCTHEIKKVTLEEAKNLGKTPCGFCY
jgi:hypothetical protein